MLMLVIIVLWIVVMTAASLRYDCKANKDIEELRQALDELEQII